MEHLVCIWHVHWGKRGRLEGCWVGWWLGEAEGVLQGMSLVTCEMHFDTRSILSFFGLHCQ